MDQRNTLGDFIIAMLLSSRSSSALRRTLWERSKKRGDWSRNNFNQNISRLKKRGIINVNEEYVSIAKQKSIFMSALVVRNQKPVGSEKILLCFDIPEIKKLIRNWLRRQLKEWGFIMIQKSLWFGNGPLPKEFYTHINLLGIKENIKVFRVSKKLQ